MSLLRLCCFLQLALRRSNPAGAGIALRSKSPLRRRCSRSARFGAQILLAQVSLCERCRSCGRVAMAARLSALKSWRSCRSVSDTASRYWSGGRRNGRTGTAPARCGLGRLEDKSRRRMEDQLRRARWRTTDQDVESDRDQKLFTRITTLLPPSHTIVIRSNDFKLRSRKRSKTTNFERTPKLILVPGGQLLC